METCRTRTPKQWGNPEEMSTGYWTERQLKRAQRRAEEVMKWWAKGEDDGKQNSTIQPNEERL